MVQSSRVTLRTYSFALLFSRSVKDGHPQWFVLGVGQVLKGLDVGLMGMCAGEKRKLTVPPSLAFGAKGKGRVRVRQLRMVLYVHDNTASICRASSPPAATGMRSA